MGWLSKIFKGSSRRKSVARQQRYDWRHGTDSFDNRPSTSWNPSSELEEIDRAIALSLSEEDQRRNVVTIDREPQVKEDEQLARALQESLNVESQPGPSSRNDYGVGSGHGYGSGYGNDYIYQPVAIPYSATFRICAGCNREIGRGRFLNCMSAIWHPECFRCRGCNHPISDYEFSVFGSHPYHKTCYTESHHPKCDVCRQFIPINAAGLIEYKAHPFWSQKYCPRHDHDGTPRCCSCERLESSYTRFAALNDGRKLCLECLDSAIMNTKECQPLFQDIQRFFIDLNMNITQQVPLFLVEKQALNEAMGVEKHGHHNTPETRGICLTEERTVSAVMHQPGMGSGNRSMPFQPTRHCEVRAILVLYGLPRLLTGTILAHEMMHAWLRLNGYKGLNQEVEEGICQVIASMWLESQILSMSDSNIATTSSSAQARSPFEMKLSKFFKHQIATDASVVYGNGFRAGHQAVLGFGLQRTLDHMWNTGRFPH